MKHQSAGNKLWLLGLILFLLGQGLWLNKFLQLYNLVPDDILFHLAQSFRFYYCWLVEHNLGAFFAYPYEYPPLVYALSALCYSCLGLSLQAAYLSLIPYGILLFAALWALGRELKTPGYGCLLCLLAAASPMLFTEAHKYLLDFPLLSMVTLNLYLWQKNPEFKHKTLSWIQGLCFLAGMMTKFSFWYFMISVIAISWIRISSPLKPGVKWLFGLIPLSQLGLSLGLLARSPGPDGTSGGAVLGLALFNLCLYLIIKIRWRNLLPAIWNFWEAYLLASLPALMWYLHFSPALIDKIHRHFEPELLARAGSLMIFNLKCLGAMLPFIGIFLSLGLVFLGFSRDYRKHFLPYALTLIVSLILSSLTQGLYWQRFMLPLLPVVLILSTYWWQGLNHPGKMSLWFWSIVGIVWFWGILSISSALELYPGLPKFIPQAQTLTPQQAAMRSNPPEALGHKLLATVYHNLPPGKPYILMGVLTQSRFNAFDPHILEMLSARDNLKPYLYLNPLTPGERRYSKDLNFLLALAAPLSSREQALLRHPVLLQRESVSAAGGAGEIWLYKLNAPETKRE